MPSILPQDESQVEKEWITYTIIGASILLALLAMVVLYDLCRRFLDCCKPEHVIYDGGLPATPGHQNSYSFSLRVDYASPTFDTKLSNLRLDLLDSKNQYLTNIVIPCFVFRFRSSGEKLDENSHQMSPFSSIKSVNSFVNSWSATRRSDLIKFRLIKNSALKNFSAIRCTHDCFKQDAFMTLRNIVVRDEQLRKSISFDLSGKPIYGGHPCPPSGWQVFMAASSN